MRLARLDILHVRNVKQVTLEPHPQFNLFWGKNGSGKTSLLEAIHLLGLGRSFRSRSAQSVITYEASSLACFGEVLDKDHHKTPMGIEKSIEGKVRCKIRGEVCEKLSQFATRLPLQLITPDTFKLLLAGPEERRRFVDWGVFHVEPLFASLTQRYLRLLKQRNAALKQPPNAYFEGWERELAESGEKIHEQRERYLQTLWPFVTEACQVLLPTLQVEISYVKGWSAAFSLSEALNRHLPQDKRWGHTSVGPHRAELLFNLGEFPASLVLSRGQQKLLICALYMAQARHLAQSEQKQCLYLLDDLGSELDGESRERVLTLLAQQNHQVFITGVSADYWPLVERLSAGEMFHVEHGMIR